MTLTRLDGAKLCPRCKRDSDEVEFHRNKSTKSGLAVYCKSCIKDKKHEHIRKNEAKARLDFYNRWDDMWKGLGYGTEN